MALTIARTVLIVLGAYLGTGVIFAAAFLTLGIGRIDPSGHGSPWIFRLLIAPGVTALWPVLARRWLSSAGRPPLPTDAHRRAARREA